MGKIKIKERPKKMQDVSFRNIDEFLEFLPIEELNVVKQLRKIIFDCVPNITEKLSYNVPFYKHHKNFCSMQSKPQIAPQLLPVYQSHREAPHYTSILLFDYTAWPWLSSQIESLQTNNF